MKNEFSFYKKMHSTMKYLSIFIAFLLVSTTFSLALAEFSSTSSLENFFRKYEDFEYKQFGYEIFENSNSQETYVIGPDYVLGPQDTINIEVWGYALQELGNTQNSHIIHKLKISANGLIIFPEIGVLSTTSLSVKDFREIVTKKYKNFCKNCSIILTIDKPRLLPILVTGNVKRPGYINVVSGSTFYDVLIAAGGVTRNGTLRRIRLNHANGKSEEIDLYDFIITGNTGNFPKVKINDSIHISNIGSAVLLKGRIKHEAIFEIKKNESVKELITYAGGVLPDAKKTHIEITKFGEKGREILVIKNRNSSKFSLEDGDSIKFLRQDIGIKNAVFLKGNVAIPQVFSWQKNLRLNDIITDVELFKPNTSLIYAEIRRYNTSKLTPSIIIFHPENILKGKKEENILLQPQDQIWLFSKKEIKEKPFVIVKGAVQKPGKYAWIENFNILNLVKESGNFKLNADLSYAEIIRYELPDREPSITVFHPRKIIGKNNLQGIILKPYDEVRFYSKEELKEKPFVIVNGAVQKPGKYVWVENLNILNLIKKSGNFKLNADLSYAEIVRYELPDMEPSITVFHPGQIVGKNDSQGIILKPYDEVRFYSKEELKEKPFVIVNGAVQKPGKYPWIENLNILNLIKKSGSFKLNADLSYAEIVRYELPDMEPSIIVFQPAKLLEASNKKEIKLIPFDEIRIFNKSELQETPMVSIDGAIRNPGKLRWVENLTIKSLINQAGGTLWKASDIVRIVRYTYQDKKWTTEMIKLSLSEIEKNPINDIPLRVLDRVTINEQNDFHQTEWQVITVGELTYPGKYPIGTDTRLSEILEHAGGITTNADLSGLKFTRVNAKGIQTEYQKSAVNLLKKDLVQKAAQLKKSYMNEEERLEQKQSMAIIQNYLTHLENKKPIGRLLLKPDDLKSLKTLKGSASDVILQHGDRIELPRKLDYISIVGEVYHPSSYLNIKEGKVSDYLSQAGGVSAYADITSAFIKRNSGNIISYGQKGKNFMDFTMKPGDVLILPSKVLRLSDQTKSQ
jgi:protein involved in polysaccharide export with SLBB domain